MEHVRRCRHRTGGDCHMRGFTFLASFCDLAPGVLTESRSKRVLDLREKNDNLFPLNGSIPVTTYTSVGTNSMPVTFAIVSKNFRGRQPT